MGNRGKGIMHTDTSIGPMIDITYIEYDITNDGRFCLVHRRVDIRIVLHRILCARSWPTVPHCYLVEQIWFKCHQVIVLSFSGMFALVGGWVGGCLFRISVPSLVRDIRPVGGIRCMFSPYWPMSDRICTACITAPKISQLLDIYTISYIIGYFQFQ